MGTMEPSHQQLLRQVIKRVHPDLFLAHPFEMKVNSDSLQALNAYADQLAVGASPTPAQLEFYVRTGDAQAGLALITATLPGDGDLLPLFSAFGLADEAAARGTGELFAPAASLAAWLRESLSDAARLAGEHAALAAASQELRTAVERAYDLGHLQLSNEYPLQCSEQRRNLVALRLLEGSLSLLSSDNPDRFQGLHLRLSPGVPGTAGNRARECHISDDGVVHLVAEDSASTLQALAALDMGRARLLARVAHFWRRRAWDLEAPLASLLGVRCVACYSNDMHSHQAFVLWAGAVLRARHRFEAALRGRAFSFGLLVHAGGSGPVLDPVPASAYVQVRADCHPSQLLEYLTGAAAAAADAASGVAEAARAAEAAALEAAREALGVRALLRLCSSAPQAAAAAARLMRCAPALRAALPALRLVSLALDDGYHVWDSGLVSIPHDFGASELEPALQALLADARVGAGASPEGPRQLPGTAASSDGDRGRAQAGLAAAATGRPRRGPSTMPPRRAPLASWGRAATRRACAGAPPRLLRPMGSLLRR
uniref:DUF4460 domain-containing protein n=1 Tax=Auxenochlorella protothecoides TaxID=3075 RepID=A0A1D2A6T3_AUXPR